MAFSFNTKNKIQEWILDYFDGDVTSIRDCANSGIGSGSCGLIYTKDINEFYRNFQTEVWESIEDYSDAIGEKLGVTIGNICEQHNIKNHDSFIGYLVGLSAIWESNVILDNVVETKDEEEEDEE